MKGKSKKLLVFEILIIIMLVLNNFVSSILSGYNEVLFIGILLVIFYFLFGFTKDRHHLWKNVCLDIIIYLLIFFMFYYLLGIIISFTRTNNYYNISFIRIIVPLILSMITKEILRYMMLCKCFNDKVLLIITCIFFINLDLVGRYELSTFSTKYDIFIFIAIVFFPIVCRNILCTYLSFKVGYKPVILYVIVTGLYGYLIPIIPNPNQYIYSIIWLILPLVLLYRMYKYFQKEKHYIKIEREFHKRKFNTLILPILLIIILVYFVSGYFHYYAIVVASGSMETSISKGDVVIIERIEKNINLLKLNQIIAYRYNKTIIVHRLVKKIIIDGEPIFYTKGDANDQIDAYKVTKDMIIGIVKTKIPFIGYPTVWINEL